MNPKEIAEELIIKMINAAARKQTSACAECFADVVFVDHSSLNGMRGALVSADEFVTSWRQPLKDAQAYTLLGNFELLPAIVCTRRHQRRVPRAYFIRRSAAGDIWASNF